MRFSPYSPVKKKGGIVAGIPRASGERNSPVGNGVSAENKVSLSIYLHLLLRYLYPYSCHHHPNHRAGHWSLASGARVNSLTLFPGARLRNRQLLRGWLAISARSGPSRLT